MTNNLFNIIFILLITVCLNAAAEKSCPEDYQTYEGGTKCFSFLPSRAQWIMAQQACQQNDGKLVELDNAFDEIFVSSQAYSFFGTYSDTDLWIGSNNLMDLNVYQWSDGSNLTFTDWKSGQPLTDGPYCVSQTYKQGSKRMQYWSSQSCFDYKFFVCEWNGIAFDPNTTTTSTTTTTTPLPTTTTPTTTTSTTTLSTTTTTTTTKAPVTIAIQTTSNPGEDFTNPPTTSFQIVTEAPQTTADIVETTTAELTAPECNFDFTFNNQDGRCYKVLDPKTVIDKDYEAGCQAFAAHLPSIHTFETNEYIVNLVANAPPALLNVNGFGITIGLRPDTTGALKWTDGSSYDFHMAFDNDTIPPNANCTVIVTDSQNPDNHDWDLVGCISDVYAFVCAGLPKKGSRN